MSKRVVRKNEESSIAVTVEPVAGHKMIVLGFHSPIFSQAVYLPVERITEVETFAMGLYNAIVTAGEKALGIPEPVKPGAKNATVNNHSS